MKKENVLWAQEVREKIVTKTDVTVKRAGKIIPYTTKDGKYVDLSAKDIGWWTNGFYGGMLWQLYNYTKNDFYKDIALWIENELDRALFDHRAMDHDSGFRFLPVCIPDYLLFDSKEAYNRLRLAADNLAGRFNPVGFIRAWNDPCDASTAGWAIIDCMMNLPLLYRAYENTKDCRYLNIATRHADTAMKYFIREDGSANHICEFDPKTGEFVRSYGGQGYKEGSSWTRGQSWALYGFTLSYLHTKEERYLDTAKKSANYFISNIPESGLIPVDFIQPKDCTYEDSTAAAIAACGLIELSKVCEGDETAKYEDAAMKLLKALVENRCDFSTDKDNIVEKCTAAFNDKDHEFAIVYGDYYLVEAIFKLTGDAIMIW